MERAQNSLDYSILADDLGSAMLVGMGESTHSCHEFFETKVEIFKALVKNHGFNTLFFESIDDSCQALDAYVQTGNGNPEALVKGLFYFYRSHEVLGLIQWLRHNHAKHPVRIIGIDERRYVDDYANNYGLEKINQRDKRMALLIRRYFTQNPKTKAMIWAHDAHIAAYVNAPFSYKEQHAPMGRHLRRWFKWDYYNVALMFGVGQFNAAVIGDTQPLDGRNLKQHSVASIPQDTWESVLDQKVHHAVFLKEPTFGGVAAPYKIRGKRSIGWGINPSEVDNSLMYYDLSQAFSALIYFPRITASHLLTDA